MSQLLARKIADVRRKHGVVHAIAGLSGLVGVVVLVLGLSMVVDWWFDLPKWARAALLVLNVILGAGTIAWWGVRPVIFPPDDDDIALAVERDQPALRSRLISAIQLVRPDALSSGVSLSLVRALVQEVEAYARPMDFTRVIRVDAMLRTLSIAVLIVLLFLGGVAWADQAANDLLRRAFLADVPVPRKTTVAVIEPDRLIARGDSVTLAADALGIVPSSGRLSVQYEGGQRQEFGLERLADSRRFNRTIDNVLESFTYRIRLYDGISQEHRVEVVDRPAVAMLECVQVYPAYVTAADPRLGSVRRAPGDLSLLAGSRLILNITANKPIARNAVNGEINRLVVVGTTPAGADAEAPPGAPVFPRILPLDVNPADATQLTSRDAGGSSVELPPGTTGFAVHLVDEHGFVTRNPSVYRIDLQPDKGPQVKVTYPLRKEELVTSAAHILIGFEAADDFALGAMRLRFKIDQNDASTEHAIELDIGKPERTLRGHYRFQLNRLPKPPAVGANIEWWLEARDTNNVTGPGIGISERFQARVVTNEEKQAELMARMGETLDPLSDVTLSQEELNRRLGQIILGRQPTTQP